MVIGKGIRHQITVVYTLQQNVERENRTLDDASTTMINGQEKLGKEFWAESIKNACYMSNHTGPSTQKSKILYKFRTRRVCRG